MPLVGEVAAKVARDGLILFLDGDEGLVVLLARELPLGRGVEHIGEPRQVVELLQVLRVAIFSAFDQGGVVNAILFPTSLVCCADRGELFLRR